jgi:flagellin
MTNVLLRMKDLATEAYNASSTASDKTAMQAEYDALGLELSNIFRTTSFGGQNLFSDGVLVTGAGGLLSAAITFQIGASAAETMSVNTGTSITALAGTAATTGLAKVSSKFTLPAPVGVELTGGTNAIIGEINTALGYVGTIRAQLGASSNRLEHVYNNLGNMMTNTTASRGRILDVDYASETSNSTSKQLLMQAGTSALKQSSSLSQLVISLMQ